MGSTKEITYHIHTVASLRKMNTQCLLRSPDIPKLKEKNEYFKNLFLSLSPRMFVSLTLCLHLSASVFVSLCSCVCVCISLFPSPPSSLFLSVSVSLCLYLKIFVPSSCESTAEVRSLDPPYTAYGRLVLCDSSRLML